MEQRDIESQCKDTELMAEWLDPSKGERLTLEISAILPTTLDLLYGVWDPTSSAARNLRTLMACILRYASSCDEPRSQRFAEARAMRPILLELYELWQRLHEGESASACSRDELREFVRTKVPTWLFKSLVEERMSTGTLEQWKRDHGEYVRSVASRVRRLTFVEDNGNDGLEEERAEPPTEDERAESGDKEGDDEDVDEYGVDQLFELSPRRGGGDNRISQHITKLDGGRLLAIRSPGETGIEVIRLDVYNVKDVARVDKRNWWRHAKIRSQFLTSTRLDRKRLLVRQLMKEAAKDLRGVSGVVREVKTLPYTGHQ